MYHGNESPPILYKLPYSYAVEIDFYNNDFYAFSHLMERLQENKNNFFGMKIHKIIPRNDGYVPPFYAGDEKILYTTRTPILTTANQLEVNMNFGAEKNGKMDEYVLLRLKRSLSHQLKCYTGIDQKFENLEIEFDDLKVFTEKYKEGVNKIGVFANFYANYQLPEMVGYATGLGYGQLVRGIKKDFDKKDEQC